MKARFWTPILSAIFFAGLALGIVATGISRDLPVGRLEGTILMKENGRPLPGTVISIFPVQAGDTGLTKRVALESGPEGEFVVPNLPAGVYTISAYANNHSTEKRKSFRIVEGQTEKLTLKLDPSSERFELYAPQRAFLPEQAPGLQFSGFFPQSSLSIRVAKISYEQLVKYPNTYLAGQQIRDEIAINAKSDKVIYDQVIQIKTKDLEGAFEQLVELPQLDSGVYVAVASVPGRKEFRQSTMFFVSRLGLLVKPDAKGIHAFVTSMDSGEKVGGATLDFFGADGTRRTATTNADGLATLQVPEKKGYEGDSLLVKMGEDMAVTQFSYYGSGSEFREYLYTDRTVYRPGDKVRFKSIFRRTDSVGRYLPPPSGTAQVTATDDEGEVVFQTTGELTRMGTFAGEFDLPKFRSTPVSLRVTVGEQEASKYIPVTAYRKPQIKLSAAPVRPLYIKGDRIEMKVKAEYFFGGAVPGATVNATVFSGSYGRNEDGYVDGSSYGEDYLGEVSGITDANGEATLTFDSNKLAWLERAGPEQTVTFNISASEDGDQYFSTSGVAVVAMSEVGLTVETDRYVASPDEPIEVTVKAFVAGSEEPLANQELNVSFAYQIYDSGKVNELKEGVRNITTDASGMATLKVFPKREGDYLIRVTGRDRAGRTSMQSTSVWVYKAGSQWTREDQSFEIRLEKSSYKVGEMVRGVIQAPKPGGDLWITLDGRFVAAEIVADNASGAATFEFKLPELHVPNGFISAAYVNDKALFKTSRQFQIDNETHAVRLKITHDRENVRPGQNVKYFIETTDEANNPVSAEVSLGVVDESVYAIMEDDEDPMAEFYPLNYSDVGLYHSFPEVYLDGGDKGDSKIDIRRDFKDTAFWQPDVVTDEKGRAVVDVKLPDNLTAWRATAVAITADTRVAKARNEVKAKKPLMARLTAPTVLRDSDSLWIAVNVTSGTDAPQDAEVTVAVSGAELVGQATQKASLKGNDNQTLRWKINCNIDADAAVIVATAKSSLGSDGMELSIPVLPVTRSWSAGGSVQLDTNKPESFEYEIPAGFEAKNAIVTVTPSIAGTLLNDLDSLIQYPYGCVEQTLSRFVPAVQARQALKDSPYWTPELNTRVDEISAASLARLEELQLPSGAFGWFGNGESDPMMTGLALEGLFQAQQSGTTVRPRLLSRTLSAAKDALAAYSKDTTWRKPQESYVRQGVYQLAAGVLMFEANASAQQALLTTPDEKAPLENLVAYFKAVSAPFSTVNRADQLRAYNRVLGRATGSPEMLLWPNDYWGQSAAPTVLGILQRLNGGEEDQLRIARGIFATRRGSYGYSTYDRGRILGALARFAADSGSLTVQGSLTLFDGDTALRTVDLNTDQPVTLELPASPGSHKLSLRFEGEGRPFVAWTIKGTVPVTSEKSAPSDRASVTVTFHQLSAQRTSEGRMALMPTEARTEFKSGESVRALIKVSAKENLGHVLIRVPLPSNLRLTDTAALDYWSYPFDGLEVFDDHVAVFQQFIAKGEAVFELNLRAENEGTSLLAPVAVEEMYAPTSVATSGITRVKVVR